MVWISILHLCAPIWLSDLKISSTDCIVLSKKYEMGPLFSFLLSQAYNEQKKLCKNIKMIHFCYVSYNSFEVFKKTVLYLNFDLAQSLGKIN